MTKPKDSTDPSSSTDKKVFDVSHPGKVAPSSTSRPVIVTNRPILRDPMMVEPGASTETEEPSLSATRIKITPPSEQENQEPAPQVDVAKQPVSPDTAEETAGEPGELSAEETPEAEPAETPVDSQPKVGQSGPEPAEEPAVTPEEPKKATTNPDDQPAEAATPEQKADAEAEAQAQKEAERQAELDKLIESQKYFLPINAVQKRRTALTVLIVVVLVVLAALAVDLALDAGLLHIDGIKPVTHFFSK